MVEKCVKTDFSLAVFTLKNEKKCFLCAAD